jgi:hypothetical protein
MKTGPQEPPRFKKVKLDVLIALIALIVIIVGVVIYTGNHHQPVKPTTSGWVHYANQKYGFQFDYPGNWGKPSVTQDKGESGSHYTVVFTDTKTSNNRNLFVSFTMDSENYQRKVCQNNQCSVISNAVTSKSIQLDLSTRASTFVSHDNSSYGFILNGNPTNTTLQEQQEIPLPAIKVSAATATFTISNATDCPLNKFAGSSQPLCINQVDYNTVNKFLKSIKSA